MCSAVAACVQQAVAAGAAGIVLDAVPYGMAQNALDAAKAKNVPIIIADQYAPTGNTNDDHVTYVQGVVDQPSDIAWWAIADSRGAAKIILAEESDSTYPFSPDHTREFLDDKPFIEPFSLIPAMGAVTERIRFITFVLKLPMRHPLLVAKQATSVAVMTSASWKGCPDEAPKCGMAPRRGRARRNWTRPSR